MQGAEHFTVVTDHRPLEGIFKKDLCDIPNPRLLRYRERLQGYVFSVTWVAGKTHLMADALSRAPLVAKAEDWDVEEAGAMCSVSFGYKENGGEFMKPSDTDYAALVKLLKTGSALKQGEIPAGHPAKEFQANWDRLSLYKSSDIIVLDGYKIVVPKSARRELLARLHASHAGLSLIHI